MQYLDPNWVAQIRIMVDANNVQAMVLVHEYLRLNPGHARALISSLSLSSLPSSYSDTAAEYRAKNVVRGCLFYMCDAVDATHQRAIYMNPRWPASPSRPTHPGMPSTNAPLPFGDMFPGYPPTAVPSPGSWEGFWEAMQNSREAARNLFWGEDKGHQTVADMVRDLQHRMRVMEQRFADEKDEQAKEARTAETIRGVTGVRHGAQDQPASGPYTDLNVRNLSDLDEGLVNIFAHPLRIKTETEDLPQTVKDLDQTTLRVVVALGAALTDSLTPSGPREVILNKTGRPLSYFTTPTLADKVTTRFSFLTNEGIRIKLLTDSKPATIGDLDLFARQFLQNHGFVMQQALTPYGNDSVILKMPAGGWGNDLKASDFKDPPQ